MLDFAGLQIPNQLKGRSVRPVCENPTLEDWRKYIVISNHMVQGAVPVGGSTIPECRGRMVRTDDYKYAVYDLGQHRESLVDMKNDPYEMRNVARDSDYESALKNHQSILRRYAAESGDQEAIEILEGR